MIGRRSNAYRRPCYVHRESTANRTDSRSYNPYTRGCKNDANSGDVNMPSDDTEERPTFSQRYQVAHNNFSYRLDSATSTTLDCCMRRHVSMLRSSGRTAGGAHCAEQQASPYYVHPRRDQNRVGIALVRLI